MPGPTDATDPTRKHSGDSPGRADYAGNSAISDLAARERKVYLQSPERLIHDANGEQRALNGYRGRQVLELIQNADDAGAGESARLLLQLTDRHLLVANTGETFSEAGIKSLVLSDCSPKQLDRSRFIGCKGLGFRSVLTWSETPLVLSGTFAVAFSPEHAKREIASLLAQSDELRVLLEERSAAALSTVPVLHFPFVPQSDNDALRAAEAARAQGYDTVVVLPLPDRESGDRVRAEIRAQLEQIGPPTLLFCRHLSRLVVETPEGLVRWRVERPKSVDGDHQNVLVQRDDEAAETWRVYRRTGRLDAVNLDDTTRSTPEFELQIAVPSTLDGDRSQRRLAIYFPTDEVLPIAPVLHATLATDDNRKRLLTHPANQQVLTALGAFLAQVAEREANDDDHHRSLRILEGLTGASHALSEMGFLSAVVDELRGRRVFPRLGGGRATLAEVKDVPATAWRQVALPLHFPELLEVEDRASVRALLERLAPPVFNAGELRDRLRLQVAASTPAEAGNAVGLLIAQDALEDIHDQRLLIAEDGGPICRPDQKVFLSPQERLPRLPAWATPVTFLHSEYREGLAHALETSAPRELVRKLRDVGLQLAEHDLQAIARNVIEAAKRPGDDQISRVRGALAWLFELTNSQTGELAWLESLDALIVTSRGSLRSASECYLGGTSRHGRLLEALYGPLGEDEFTAEAANLGLPPDSASDDLERFLARLGVAVEPRWVTLAGGAPQLHRDYCAHVIAGLEFPVRRFTVEYDREEFDQSTRSPKILDQEVPDRLASVLEKAPAEALIAFVHDNRERLLERRGALGVLFGRERTHSQIAGPALMNAALWCLRTSVWVPSGDDGIRRPPTRLTVLTACARALQGIFFLHRLDAAHPLLEERGGAAALRIALMALGAIAGVEDLDVDTLYTMLAELPKSDPRGEIAERLYRAVLEADPGPGGARGEAFRRTGQIWGVSGGIAKYVPIESARFLGQRLPRAIEHALVQSIPIAKLPPDAVHRRVKAIFGIDPIAGEELELALVAAEDLAWADVPNAHLRRAIPYLYALRLHTTDDTRGEDLRRLKRVSLRVCSRAVFRISILGGESWDVALEHPGEGLALDADGTLVLIEHGLQPMSSPHFWLDVANVLAQYLKKRDVASDAGHLLGCTHDGDMLRVLDRLTLGAAETLLQRARGRLGETLPEEPVGRVVVPPARPVEQAQVTSPAPTEPATSPGDCSPGPSATDFETATLTIRPAAPPEERASAPRSLIVRRESIAPPRAPQSPAGEDKTLPFVLAFERSEGRFPLDVHHVTGRDGPGCDVLSFLSAEALARAQREGTLLRYELDRCHEVDRFIEVKGRANKGGHVGLSDNEARRAAEVRERYFIYRVDVDRADPRRVRLGILQNPIGSGGRRDLVVFHLGEGSGATWLDLRLDEPICQPDILSVDEEVP
ncbi:MAG: DUF3883 domain-containing protein [Planctomycetes bacterium]|nr:DUF3883 domain-containing protein [Planctomycetota bacterium]